MALTRFRRCFKREGFYLKDVFNGHNLQSLDKYMDENIVSHWLGGGTSSAPFLMPPTL
jgi:hypothetical protein